MNSPDLLRRLHDASQAARNLYASAAQRHDSPGLRALKLYLAERHAEHLRDLRELLHGLGAGEPSTSGPYRVQGPGWRAETLRGLNSTDRARVLVACLDVEQQLALVYREAGRDAALDAASEIIGRHLVELETSQAFVRQIEAERNRQSAVAARSLATL